MKSKKSKILITGTIVFFCLIVVAAITFFGILVIGSNQQVISDLTSPNVQCVYLISVCEILFFTIGDLDPVILTRVSKRKQIVIKELKVATIVNFSLAVSYLLVALVYVQRFVIIEVLIPYFLVGMIITNLFIFVFLKFKGNKIVANVVMLVFSLIICFVIANPYEKFTKFNFLLVINWHPQIIFINIVAAILLIIVLVEMNFREIARVEVY